MNKQKRKESRNVSQEIKELRECIERIKNDEEEKFCNMPESSLTDKEEESVPKIGLGLSTTLQIFLWIKKIISILKTMVIKW